MCFIYSLSKHIYLILKNKVNYFKLDKVKLKRILIFLYSCNSVYLTHFRVQTTKQSDKSGEVALD